MTGFKCIRPNLDSEIAAYAKNRLGQWRVILTEYQCGDELGIEEEIEQEAFEKKITVVMMKMNTTTKEKVMSDNTKEVVEQEVAETPEGTIKRLNEELEKQTTQIQSPPEPFNRSHPNSSP